MNTPRAEADGAAPQSVPTRLYGIDALRGVSSLLVVLLHAAVPYLVYPMPGLIWPTRNTSSSLAVDTAFWWIEGFIMPLFFLIGGFFSFQLWQRLGSRKFIPHRARRLLVPLLFGMVFILPVDLFIWGFGWIAEGRESFANVMAFEFDREFRHGVKGLAHLWFLQYLFLLCVVFCGLGAWAEKVLQKVSGTVSTKRFLTPFVVACLLIGTVAALCSGALWLDPEVMIGFQHSFLPYLPKALHSAVFFAAGWWIARHPWRLAAVRWAGPACLVFSCAAFVWMIPLVRAYLANGQPTGPNLPLVVSMGLFAALTTLGLFGLSLRRAKPNSRFIAFLADASFWVYLVHHPVVGLVQTGLAPLVIAPAIKCALVTILATAFSLVTYQFWVRNGWIGAVLSGRKPTENRRAMKQVETPAAVA